MIAGGYLYSENKAEGKLEPNFFYLREGYAANAKFRRIALSH